MAVDVGDQDLADRLTTRMQEAKIGLLALSLGYFKMLSSPPTSSEVPVEELHATTNS